MTPRAKQGGFTLIEILVALAILATTLMVLLDAHYNAIRLFDETRNEYDLTILLERAVGEAEVAVNTGMFSGEGEFGKRYPECTFSFEANPVMGGEAGAQGGSTGGALSTSASSRSGLTSSTNTGQETDTAGLYEVTVTVTTPNETRTFTSFVFLMAPPGSVPGGDSSNLGESQSGMAQGNRLGNDAGPAGLRSRSQ
jgi:prepilin-type N-terminal cleavage/methylation domain-containing protein